MKPCETTTGVIFDSEELPRVTEALAKYVQDQRILHTAHAAKVYAELLSLHNPKYGYWGGAFVPADEALAVSAVIKSEIDAVEPRSITLPLGMFSMVHVAMPQGYERRRRFADCIEKTVRESRAAQT